MTIAVDLGRKATKTTTTTCMNYKLAYLNALLLLHSVFMLSVVKMPIKGEFGGCTLNSHGNYIVDRGNGIVFLDFYRNMVHL